MNKKVSIVLAVLLAFALLAGCGGSSNNQATQAAQEATTAAATTTTAKATEAKAEETTAAAKEEATTTTTTAATTTTTTTVAVEATIKDTTKDIEKTDEITYNESPFLQGKGLPPVKDRLPKVPKLVNEIPEAKLDYQIGKYGGTFRMVTSVVNWDADVFVMNDEPLLNSPGVEGMEVTANVLQAYEVSDDQTEFTFTMREGMKWSDGTPVTMEDIRFTIEDMIFNEEFTPSFPQWLRSGNDREGEPVKFSIVDDWTFKMKFDKPYGGLLIRLSVNGWKGYSDWLKPSHYLKQFHPKYATDADKAKWDGLCDKYNIPKGEALTWVNLMTQMNVNNWDLTNRKAIGFPTLNAWMMVESTETVNYYERNPYYFKVDSAGNQLPYVDKIESLLVSDMEMVQLKAISGEVDFMRESASLFNMPLYKENEATGGYTVYMCNMHVTPTDILLNLTYDGGPGYREMVMDKRFRKALSMAIDRDEINDSIYYGLATPSKYQDPTYDPDGAMALLEEMGMVKGANGFYLQPNGNPFQIIFEIGAEAPDIVPVSELVMEFWRDIGIDASFRRIESALVGRKQNANELQGRIIWTSYPHWPYMDYGYGAWCRLWVVWKNNITEYTVTLEDGTVEKHGIKGEEPPDEVKEFFKLVDRQNLSPLGEAVQLYEEIKKNLGENYWFIIPFETVRQPLLINSKIRNVTDKTYAIGVNFAAEQLWYDN